MDDIESGFKIHCGKAFRFLAEEYSCWNIPDDLSEYRAACVWRNTTTAVTVSLELTYPGLFVKLSRLVDDRIPETPIHVENESVLHSFYLEDLVTLRGPHEIVRYKADDLWNPDKVAELVYLDALLTRKHASDILRGDFAIFQELERIVRDRAVRLKLGLSE
jgi:hypothetical protein